MGTLASSPGLRRSGDQGSRLGRHERAEVLATAAPIQTEAPPSPRGRLRGPSFPMRENPPALPATGLLTAAFGLVGHEPLPADRAGFLCCEKLVVVAGVSRGVNHPEVFWAVVEPIAVDVMDKFIGVQGSAKPLFCYRPVD
jgi:hypothetical protein